MEAPSHGRTRNVEVLNKQYLRGDSNLFLLIKKEKLSGAAGASKKRGPDGKKTKTPNRILAR